jgi:acetoin utilization deacetylase AcuC-like enzyme
MDAEKLSIFWHEDVLLHDSGASANVPQLEVTERHPDSADRLRNMKSLLERGPLSDALTWCAGRHANHEELTRFHSPAYVEEIRHLSEVGQPVVLDRFFAISAGTWLAASAAAGCAIAAAESVLRQPGIAAALVRPPGHHAVADRGEGYCIFNNCGLAALAARTAGADRVAIVDWDAHHGNGAQSFFYRRADVLTLSLHVHTGSVRVDRSGGDGLATEIGDGDGLGATININFPPGTGDRGYRDAFDEIVRPALSAFRPDLIIGAMGQDASMNDANGRQCLTMRGFHQIGAKIRGCAERYSRGRLIFIEEGGYSLTYAPLCLYATLAGALGRPIELEDPVNYLPEDRWTHYRPALDDARTALRVCQDRSGTRA